MIANFKSAFNNKRSRLNFNILDIDSAILYKY